MYLKPKSPHKYYKMVSKKTGLFPRNPSAVEQMFQQFQKEIETVRDDNVNSRKQKDLHCALVCMERYIDTSTLKAFKQVPMGNEWNDPQGEKSLFHVWRALKDYAKQNSSPLSYIQTPVTLSNPSTGIQTKL